MYILAGWFKGPRFMFNTSFKANHSKYVQLYINFTSKNPIKIKRLMKFIAFLEKNFDYRIVLLLFVVIFVKYVKKVLFFICYVKPHWNRKPKDEKGFKTFEFWKLNLHPRQKIIKSRCITLVKNVNIRKEAYNIKPLSKRVFPYLFYSITRL